jgi:two-component system, response regulator
MTKRVLLVEDNDDDIELTLRALEKNNIVNEVVVVRDGGEALEYLFRTGRYADKADEDLPEVVLLDLKLPIVGGLDVLRRIRGNEQTKLMPVVVLTSSSEDRDMVESYRLGANSYVQKPVDFSEFVSATRQIGLYWLVLNRRPSPYAIK